MKNEFDDGLDEYIDQMESNPTVPESEPGVPQQRKSAEMQEIEKILEVLKGINEVQRENRIVIQEQKEMTEKVESLSGKFTDEIRKAKPIWHDLLRSFVDKIEIGDESLEAFEEMMKTYADRILTKICDRTDKIISEKIAGQFVEVANKHIEGFDEKLSIIDGSFRMLREKYEDSQAFIKAEQSRLVGEMAEAGNCIFVPRNPFNVLLLVFIIIVVFGGLGFAKYCAVHTNAAPVYMIGAVIVNVIYLAAALFRKRSERKKCTADDKNKKQSEAVLISFSQSLYLVQLTAVLMVYGTCSFVAQNMNSPVLEWLLPLSFGANFIFGATKYVFDNLR